MPVLVHIADERDAQRIRKGGIKIGKYQNGVFFTPISQDYFASHQWLRELKRNGTRTMVGVYFKLPANEIVWYGKYNRQHKQGSLGSAISAFQSSEDRLGFEFLIERKIEPKEIHKIRAIPQKVGWRYFPKSHEAPLNCACPMCITRGEINARKKINKLEPPEPVPSYLEILERLRKEEDEFEIESLFRLISRKRRKSDPEAFRFIIERAEVEPIQSLACALSSFKHPNAEKMLRELCEHEDEDVRRFGAEGLIELNEEKGLNTLQGFSDDLIIKEVINEHTNEAE